MSFHFWLYMQSSGTSIILYPRSYNKRGDVSLHSVQGVTPDGLEINVKLRISSVLDTSQPLPSIFEFARVDRRALQACVASPYNSASKREGMLLFTDAVMDTNNRRGIPSYIAKWASVLAADSDSDDPILGIGCLLREENEFVTGPLRLELDRLLERGGLSDADAIANRLKSPLNYRYKSIVYVTDRYLTFSSESFSDSLLAVSETISDLSNGECQVGLSIKLIDGQGYIVDNSFFEISPSDDIESEFEFYYHSLLSKGIPPGSSIHILPIISINTVFDPVADMQLLVLALHMYNQSSETVGSLFKIAIRNCVLRNVNSKTVKTGIRISDDIESAIRIDREGGFGHIFKGEEHKSSYSKRLDSNQLKEHEIGLKFDCLIQRSLSFFCDSNCDVINGDVDVNIIDGIDIVELPSSSLEIAEKVITKDLDAIADFKDDTLIGLTDESNTEADDLGSITIDDISDIKDVFKSSPITLEAAGNVPLDSGNEVVHEKLTGMASFVRRPNR